MRSSAPPFRHACCFGVDIPDKENLLASCCSMEEIRERLDVDSPAKLAECSRDFCTACFDGDYSRGVK